MVEQDSLYRSGYHQVNFTVSAAVSVAKYLAGDLFAI